MEREIEVSGKDVETAVEIGLATWGVSRDDVTVEIIDEGSRGLLGIGSRDAVVKLTRLSPPVVAEPVAPVVEEVIEAEPEAEEEIVVIAEPVVAEEPAQVEAVEEESADDGSDEESDSGEESNQRETAVEIVETLLQKMQIDATITTSLSEEDDITRKRIDVIEINGEDLGTLIGPRGETLNSVQYIARLMTSHKLQERADFVIDVQGYRKRRQENLARLAERMAQKAVQRGTPVGLEPMPPHERRAIHMALRNSDEVYTESAGEGNRRKVRIIPK